MQITREELANLRKKVDAMFKSLEDETGFKIKLGNISYTENTFTGKIEGTKVVPGETAEDVERKLFTQNCYRYGLEKEDFGKTFKYGGKTYSVVGIKPKAQKNTVLIKDINTDKTYVMNHEDVAKFLKMEREV